MQADIAIIGGGLVGLTAALALSRQGWSVALIESSSLAIDDVAELDSRSIALSLSSWRILEALDVATEILAHSAPIEHIHVSSSGRFGVTRITADDCGEPFMGRVVEYSVLLKTLLQQARQQSLVQLVNPAKVTCLDSAADSATVVYRNSEGEHSLTVSLLILADGGKSDLKHGLGISTRTDDYGQSAIIANLLVESNPGAVAFERFTPQGPLAMLPLTGGRYSLVWTRPQEQLDDVMNCDDAEFINLVYRSFGYRLGRFSEVGQRAALPLNRKQATPLINQRVVLIGNAANTLHPVAGQGFNLALRDVACLYDLLAEQGMDLNLDLYPRQRDGDHQRTNRLGHNLVALFSNDLPILNHARAGALALLDLCPALKTQFAWRGMGYTSAAYSLMRGV